MNCQFCMCSAQAGYPHLWSCPYPLFGGSAAQQEAWEKAYRERCDAYCPGTEAIELAVRLLPKRDVKP